MSHSHPKLPATKKAGQAVEIVRELRRHGHETYFVGGCVRDMVMGLDPTDYDIATSARPEAVTALFPRTEPIGAKFGVILVIHRGHPFEVATFRSDQAYVDGRRPTGVVFTGPREDVFRRDFTINGLLYDPVGERLLDYVGGRADIEARLVRAIGDPHARFREDKLRLLRAVRFGARLGYTIEARTWDAVRAMAPDIHQVSPERVREELVRILTEGQAARGLRMLEESGLRREILGELEWTPRLERTLERLDRGRPADFAMAVLLHECAPADVRRIVLRLRFSNTQSAHIEALVGNQARLAEAVRLSQSSLKRLLRLERFEDHLELHRLGRLAAGGSLETFEFLRRRREEWPPEVIRPNPLISGDDLIKLGLAPGPAFKEILIAVEDEQLEGRLDDSATALEFVRARFLAG